MIPEEGLNREQGGLSVDSATASAERAADGLREFTRHAPSSHTPTPTPFAKHPVIAGPGSPGAIQAQVGSPSHAYGLAAAQMWTLAAGIEFPTARTPMSELCSPTLLLLARQ